jgi:hypothetical protein
MLEQHQCRFRNFEGEQYLRIRDDFMNCGHNLQLVSLSGFGGIDHHSRNRIESYIAARTRGLLLAIFLDSTLVSLTAAMSPATTAIRTRSFCADYLNSFLLYSRTLSI